MSSPSFNIDALIDAVHGAIAARGVITPSPSPRRPGDREVYAWGITLDFSVDGKARRFFGLGWSEPEPGFCWTRGNAAELRLPVTPLNGTDLLLTARIFPHISARTPAQVVRISANGSPAGQWVVSDAGEYHVVIFSRHFSGQTPLVLRFDLPHAFSPHSQELSADSRVLGVGFHSLALRPDNRSS